MNADRTRRPLLILLYHAVIREPLAVPDWCFLPEAVFHRQMAFLRSGKFDVRPLEEAQLPADAGCDGPMVAVTFDDGYRNNFEYAYPILKEFDIPATIFPATDFIDTHRRPWFCEVHRAIGMTHRASLAWQGTTHDLTSPESRSRASAAIQRALKAYPQDRLLAKVGDLLCELDVDAGAPFDDDRAYQIVESRHMREMMASGLIAFGSHTASHAILAHLPQAERRHEICDSIARLHALLQRPCTLFAYPNGRAQDYDAGVLAMLRDNGIRTAVTAIEGGNPPGQSSLELRRCGIGNDPGLDIAALLATARVG